MPAFVGKEQSGILMSAEDVQMENGIQPHKHKFGIQHPMQNKLADIRNIINLNYSDPHLEAKRWPRLFPHGTGSWKRNSALKQQTYVKHRLLYIDSRFRKNKEFLFFWYDRLIKERILYVNNRQRTVNVGDLVNNIQAKDIKDNNYKYGSTIPSTVPGSKTYWRARTLDLLALVRDLGKPDLFVTLTQNDNWFELQKVCGEISTKELNALNQPIMQPAIGGESVVNFPVETVVAFYRRLDIFMTSCIQNKKGPFGEVLDYWYRIEYQNRGALHCHMILWLCEDTIPNDIVMAELPRYSGNLTDIKNSTSIAREYVKTFQMHSCVVGSCKKDAFSKCKYGFPYDIQISEEINESKMGYKYMRHSAEDRNVVPYNLHVLMLWNGLINVQKVTLNGIEAYLCKYVSKPEKSIDIKDITSEAERFVKARVVGILECSAHLLQYHQVHGSRKTIFLPCEFQPKRRMLKRRSHLPVNNDSEDVYYKTLLDKYLFRPKELNNYTYVDLYRFYDVVSSSSKTNNITESQITDDEDSELELHPKQDETQFDLKNRSLKVRSQRQVYFNRGHKYVERGKAAVPRWRFLVPFGNETERYYEQHLLLNVPIVEDDLNEDGYPFSDENQSKTFVEECCLRALIDSEQTAKSALLGAIRMGFSVDRVIELAKMFVDQEFVTKQLADSIVIPWIEQMPSNEDKSQKSENEYSEEVANMINMRQKYEPLKTYMESMTNSQKQIMEWVQIRIRNNDQIMAIISGGAGVGKSYITKSLYSFFIESKMVCMLLATTGSAAHIIGGTTVHYYLKVDITGKSYLEAGTIPAKVIEDTDVIIIDEFSMLSSDLLMQLNNSTTEYGRTKNSLFGGKHIFLIGDPCQLPTIGKSVFTNPILNEFSILLLKETVRQKDESFSSLLNRVRINQMTDIDKSVLRSRYTHVSDIKTDDNTLIVTATRAKMKSYNEKLLTKIPGKVVSIKAEDYECDTNKVVSAFIKSNIRRYVPKLWDEVLNLKEGCIVRLLRNMDVSSGWVNSKRAKVFRLANDGSFIILSDIEEPTKQMPITKIRQPFKLGGHSYYRYQYPLILGYATTVHAVQGTTATGNLYIDLDRGFWESGQGFVALSRPKELTQLYLLNTHFEKIYIKPYYKKLLEWMIEVDEISIFKKPRITGDFPILPVEEDEKGESSVFPEITEHEEVAKVRQFMPPRLQAKQLNHRKEVKSKIECCVSPNMENKQNIPNESNGDNVRLTKLAKAFSNCVSNNTSQVNQIRFGTKFMNEFLDHINKTLSIYHVSDPLFLQPENINEVVLQTWEDQVGRAISSMRHFITRYRIVFETMGKLIEDLNICVYNKQNIALNTMTFTDCGKLYTPVNTSGDGRCFYHSVSYNLIGNDSLSNSLKLYLCYKIVSEYDMYESFFSRYGQPVSHLLLKILSYHCWTDFVMISAMSYALVRPILVITGLSYDQAITSNKYNPRESDKEPINIGFVKISPHANKPNHFVALLRDDSYSPDIVEFRNLSIRPKTHKNYDIISIPEDDIEMLEEYDSTDSL